jgi:hypothetical protein
MQAYFLTRDNERIVAQILELLGRDRLMEKINSASRVIRRRALRKVLAQVPRLNQRLEPPQLSQWQRSQLEIEISPEDIVAANRRARQIQRQ